MVRKKNSTTEAQAVGGQSRVGFKGGVLVTPSGRVVGSTTADVFRRGTRRRRFGRRTPRIPEEEKQIKEEIDITESRVTVAPEPRRRSFKEALIGPETLTGRQRGEFLTERFIFSGGPGGFAATTAVETIGRGPIGKLERGVARERGQIQSETLRRFEARQQSLPPAQRQKVLKQIRGQVTEERQGSLRLFDVSPRRVGFELKSIAAEPEARAFGAGVVKSGVQTGIREVVEKVSTPKTQLSTLEFGKPIVTETPKGVIQQSTISGVGTKSLQLPGLPGRIQTRVERAFPKLPKLREQDIQLVGKVTTKQTKKGDGEFVVTGRTFTEEVSGEPFFTGGRFTRLGTGKPAQFGEPEFTLAIGKGGTPRTDFTSRTLSKSVETLRVPPPKGQDFGGLRGFDVFSLGVTKAGRQRGFSLTAGRAFEPLKPSRIIKDGGLEGPKITFQDPSRPLLKARPTSDFQSLATIKPQIEAGVSQAKLPKTKTISISPVTRPGRTIGVSTKKDDPLIVSGFQTSIFKETKPSQQTDVSATLGLGQIAKERGKPRTLQITSPREITVPSSSLFLDTPTTTETNIFQQRGGLPGLTTTQLFPRQPGFPKGVPFGLPFISLGGGGRRRKVKRKARGRRVSFTPSLTALALDLRGSRQPFGELSGLGIRPIPTKRRKRRKR